MALKRKTPLRAKSPLKRTKIRNKPKRHVNITPEVVAGVNQRANASVGVGRCESCGTKGDWRGMCYAEPIKGLGGSTRSFSVDEVRRKCYPCHVTNDHHLREVKSEPQWTQY